MRRLLFALVLLVGCSGVEPKTNEKNPKIVMVDGVRCIVYAARGDNGVAISCDWGPGELASP